MTSNVFSMAGYRCRNWAPAERELRILIPRMGHLNYHQLRAYYERNYGHWPRCSRSRDKRLDLYASALMRVTYRNRDEEWDHE